MRRREFLISTGALAGLDPRVRRLAGARSRPAPTSAQLGWHQDELALFLHFGVNTFTDQEWGDGSEDPAIFNPAGLDARQWAGAAKSAGFKLLILTAKHHDGFCLWPSRLTTHSVASSPWRESRGDVVREFTDACRAEGLKAGLYLSPWDRHERSYGDSPRYNDFYIGQLTELLTQYGTLAEVWFDGANGEGPNGKRQVYDWPRIHRTVRKLQPNALMFSDAGPDIRWIGNERGTAGDPNWCTMDPAAVPYAGAQGPGIIEALQHGDPTGTVWRPGEADVSIRPGWFYHPAEDSQVRSAENLMELYRSSVGKNAGLLLNVPPNRDGLLSRPDVASLGEFGRRVKGLYSTDVAHGDDVQWTAAVGRPVYQLSFRQPVSFDHICLQEAIQHGQHVSRHSVETWNGTAWTPLIKGSTIGSKRLHRVPVTRTDQVRLVIGHSFEAPRIANILLLNGTELT